MQQNSVILVFVAAIFAFLLNISSIFSFFNSSNDFFNKMRYAKYLRSKEIYTDPVTNELNRDIAKEIIDSSQFKQLTGIDIDKKSRQKLVILANQSEDKNTWTHIRNSIKYLSFDRDLPETIPENLRQKLWRYFLNLCASVFAIVGILCAYILIFVELPVKYYIFNIFLILLFYFLFIYFLRKASYFYSLKKLNKIINNIKRSSESENN